MANGNQQRVKPPTTTAIMVVILVNKFLTYKSNILDLLSLNGLLPFQFLPCLGLLPVPDHGPQLALKLRDLLHVETLPAVDASGGGGGCEGMTPRS